jgi:lipopolysaccharide/colanic/teichoic acid biosynthesis glycosyltransferase
MHLDANVADLGHAEKAPARPKPPAARPHCPLRMRRPAWYARGKRALDVAGALALLALAGPVMLLAALLVKLTSRGPAFYSQTRLGLHGRPFTLYKIRSMHHDCERHSGPRWCRPGDPRVMPLGRFLRKTHIDELPQLWNVLRGDMSLVGPRPERPEFVPQLERAILRYRDRLLVAPGLTGLAQVQLPPDSDLESVRVKLAYDLWYVQRHGLWLDLRIAAATAFHLAGLRWRALRWLLLVPEQADIEQEYWALAGEVAPAPRVQPA